MELTEVRTLGGFLLKKNNMILPYQIMPYLDKFTKIDDANPLPEKGNYYVFCEGNRDKGFVYNTNANKIGIQALIAVSFIKSSELKKLIKI